MPEKTIGEFELFTDKLIGKGAWGEVYHGRQKSLNRPVAIKILKKELTEDPDFVKRFRRESETLAKMVDEHIIQVYSAGEYEGSYYFIMEYVQGQPLNKFIERSRKFSTNEIVYVGDSVARALKTAWESPAKIVHRDIKPSNIMVSYTSSLIAPLAQKGVSESMVAMDINILEARIKVMDFGLAKLTEGDKEATMVGTVIGTPKYISPEQGMGNPADTRSDIYSLGIVMYEMATGRIPFESETAMSMIRHHIYDTAMAPSEYNPEIPQDLENIIMRCIQKDPNSRYTSPNELLEDLTAFKQQQTPVHASGAAIEATMISDVVRGKKKTRLAFWGGLVGLLMLGGFASYMFMFKPDKTESDGGIIPSPQTRPPTTLAKPEATVSAPADETKDKPEIDEELKELLDQLEAKISEDQLEEAWQLLQEALTQAPDLDKVKELQQKLQEKINAKARLTLAEALIQENLTNFSDSPLLTMEQKKFNYILSLLDKKRYNDVRGEVNTLIDLDDEIISAAALYFQMKVLALEKKSGHLSEMDKLASKMETFYASSKCVPLAKKLIEQTRAELLEQTWQSCLTEIAGLADLNKRIQILEQFIQANPENPYISEARVEISRLKDQIEENLRKQYESLIDLSQRYQEQELYIEAIQQVIAARKIAQDKTQEQEVQDRRDEIELAFLETQGIRPLKEDRDTASYCHKFIKSKQDDVAMVLIPNGSFTMGANDGAPDEQPVHQVTLAEYYIDQCEVTNEQFAKFVEATGYTTEAEKSGYGWVWLDCELQKVKGACWRDPAGDGRDIKDQPNHPVVQVSWNDAQAYTQWAGKRLPTEAEWEKAARGNKTTSYPWGNQWQSAYCNNIITGPGQAEPVRNYESGQSPFGCHNMSGNIEEWCRDWYSANYYEASTNHNPQGPKKGQSHTLRGGSWVVGQPWLSTTVRVPGKFENQTNFWSNYIGFRCVKDVPKELLPYLRK